MLDGKCTDRWEFIERGEKNVGTNEKSASQKDTDGETKLSERNGKSAGCSSPGRQSSDFISPQLLCAVQQLRAGMICRSIFRLRCSTTIRNISPKEEYEARTEEVQRLIRELPAVHPIRFVEGKYDPECYYEAVRGHEKDPEGGERCGICFEMRLREAAKLAAEGGYDWFTTTLTISPLKNAGRLNTIGQAMGEEYHVAFLPSDFKKKEGYKRSIELSAQYHLYRQNYCGCVFSKREREEQMQKERQETS